MKTSFVTALLALLISSVQAADVRPPAVAGQFYPRDPAELATTVDTFLQKVPDMFIPGRPIGLLVPHAGYTYSGQVAAYAYAALPPDITTVVLIGNSHRFPLQRGAVYATGSWTTPLGIVPVDEPLARALLTGTPLLKADRAPHGPEHSLEVQVPFLQRRLKKFSILPVLLGNMPLKDCRAVGTALAAAIKSSGHARTTIVIASSDMSHYPSQERAAAADMKTLKTLAVFDPAALKKTIDGIMAEKIPNEECALCGEEAVYTAMYATRALGATKARGLAYANAGDAGGDRARVVGYGAYTFLRDESGRHTKEALMSGFSVAPSAQQELLRIARTSIEHRLTAGTAPAVNSANTALREPAAVFVTLTERGELRGCIGTTEPRAPLAQAVSQMAIAAATEDPRFPPVTLKDLAGIRIEVSVLSPMRRIKDPAEIQKNVHGVVVRKGTRSGLFLPQVWEHFPTKEAFMDELCRQKAGLPADAWKRPDTELYVFTAFAFQEPR